MSTSSLIKNPTILSIAGVDPSGGAGVLADVKTISALGGYACSVIAALTAQNTQAVTGIYPVSPEFIRSQLDTLCQDLSIHAVKIGMLGQVPVIETIAEGLSRWELKPVVLDPVMVAKSGDHLLELKAVGALTEMLLPLATMITPNLPEAAVLLNQSAPESVKEMYKMAERLRHLLNHHQRSWVYLKGGHLPGDQSVDLLYDGDQMIEFRAPKHSSKNTHGTGCTLSAALATLLPQYDAVPEAAKQAKQYITEAILTADRLMIGHGHGPVNHFHSWWP